MRLLLQKLTIVFSLCVLFSSVEAVANNQLSETQDYSRLFDFIKIEDLDEPLVVFADLDGEFDRDLNQENIAYLNQNKALLNGIKNRLPGEILKWRLSSSSKRLIVVPEQRQEYAVLFERYCHDAIDYALHMTQLPNPYQEIATLQATVPSADDKASEGITAYLVHNIIDEYIEEYLFFNEDDEHKKIKIKLSNRVFSGKVGSYTSKLVIAENSQFEFIQEPFTLWQNSAQDPLNVLIAPIEETLHIGLRDATQTAIQTHLREIEPQTMDEVERVVDDWMAVEEAIVGGLVSHLMPKIFARFLEGPLKEKVSASLAARDEHDQYRYLQKGIQVVTDLGLRPAISLYQSEPQRFKQLISKPRHLAAAPS